MSSGSNPGTGPRCHASVCGVMGSLYSRRVRRPAPAPIFDEGCGNGSSDAPTYDRGMAAAEYAPQLATLVKAPPTGDLWLHEIKFDGYRLGCLIRKGVVRLITRSGNDWTDRFPEIVSAANALELSDALIDGEVAMLMADGRTSFEALQQVVAGTTSRGPLVYLVFDLLRVDGHSIARLPLEQRKARLQALVKPAKTGRIRFVD